MNIILLFLLLFLNIFLDLTGYCYAGNKMAIGTSRALIMPNVSEIDYDQDYIIEQIEAARLSGFGQEKPLLSHNNIVHTIRSQPNSVANVYYRSGDFALLNEKKSINQNSDLLYKKAEILFDKNGYSKLNIDPEFFIKDGVYHPSYYAVYHVILYH
jgi:hypothetical protein